jgi:hypothetical protein
MEDADAVYRFHYRSSLKKEYGAAEIKVALEECQAILGRFIAEGKIMTAALYHHRQLLFFYYECIGRELKPKQLLKPLSPYLERWPGQEELREWVDMYPIFYHALPKGKQDWTRPKAPELRRGRIAFLKPEKLFSYVYHHQALVDEGLWHGDKYQFIALHENILFSYFEEPKTITNLQGNLEKPSQAIQEWLKAVPEDHFIRLPEGKGENFMFIPAYFALGQS